MIVIYACKIEIIMVFVFVLFFLGNLLCFVYYYYYYYLLLFFLSVCFLVFFVIVSFYIKKKWINEIEMLPYLILVV